jgi:hypothetical protein
MGRAIRQFVARTPASPASHIDNGQLTTATDRDDFRAESGFDVSYGNA